MEIPFTLAIVVIPLVPIFLLSRLLIWALSEFVGSVSAILLGNAVALVLMFALGAFALSTTGTPDWARSVSLFTSITERALPIEHS